MLARMAILFVCFVGGAGFIARHDRTESIPIRAPFSTFPMQIGEWRGVQQPPMEPRVLEMLGVNDYLTRAYFRSDRAGVGLYIGYFESQRQGDTIHSPLNCLPGAGWTPVSKNTIQIALPSTGSGAAASPIEVNRYVIAKGLDQQLVLYWYQSRGRVVASEYWSKFYLVRDAFQLNRTDGSLVRVIAPIDARVDGSDAAAEKNAVMFTQAMFPVLDTFLPR
jgi:EpsI family protein